MNGIIFSVVVPTRNRVFLLKQCLASLIAQDFPEDAYEIIVINDASTDSTDTYLLTLPSRKIKIIRNDVRKGHAFSRNAGFSLSRGKYIASTDDDCIVLPQWLKSMLLYFMSYPEIAAVGGGILNSIDNNLAWAEYLLNFSSWFPFGKARCVKNIPTCNIAYRRDIIQPIRFEENSINIAYRDALFNYLIHRMHKKIMFDPRLEIIHHSSTTLLSYLKKQKRFGMGLMLGGYRVHGWLGKIIVLWPRVQYLHLICVFTRCLRNRHYLKKFLQSFRLILLGEYVRIKTLRHQIYKPSEISIDAEID